MTNGEQVNTDSTIQALGSARASRARFGALAETRLRYGSADQRKSLPWRGRHGQHAGARALPRELMVRAQLSAIRISK